MSQVELVCIKLGESTAPGGKKFWKTCTFRTFCTRQSWERIGPALGSGALSGNHFCTQLAPYAPVCGVSGISRMSLYSLRPLLLCVSALKVSHAELWNRRALMGLERSSAPCFMELERRLLSMARPSSGWG